MEPLSDLCYALDRQIIFQHKQRFIFSILSRDWQGPKFIFVEMYYPSTYSEWGKPQKVNPSVGIPKGLVEPQKDTGLALVHDSREDLPGPDHYSKFV